MKFSDLEFVRVDRPDLFELLVPKYLIERIPGRSWTVERLYRLAPSLVTNSSNCIWALIDKKKATKGVLWIVIDVLSEKLNVIAFAVDEEYEDESNLADALDFLRRFINSINAATDEIRIREKINWITPNPKMLDKLGGRLPETVLVEV